ncbi:hypothetical protein AS189_16650 [Arthrobacter alpinus]|uniref:DUF58 domain-containing protein n=2 Tax=Arthrobacter alpinus TaxID=656366 RepID=A0A0S2M208_9MICC|nr:hypothetical protein AS189_16650 [Arthrobacter alpinus]
MLRGWLLLAAGALALLLALVLGRRDLLMLAIFCLALPGAACAGLLWFKPGFSVKRHISPGMARAGSAVSVVLEVRGQAPGGARARLTEELPYSFYTAPVFSFPNPIVPRGPVSRYHYEVVPPRRGVFAVGPLRAEFSDPFGVAFLKRILDDGGQLTVAPAAVELASISLSDGRGQDGSRTTKELAHASHDDAMTREYRSGDPLRRVHWPVTARQGKLMVRAEESVTAPEAAVVLDRRHHAFGDSHPFNQRTVPEGSGHAGERNASAGLGGAGFKKPTSSELHTTPTFEKAVSAVASITAHLLERGYSLRVLDHGGNPGFESSASAITPAVEDFSGSQGIFDVAAALAALELEGASGAIAGAAASESDSAPFGNTLAYKLHHGRRRGPLVAVTGLLDDAAALRLASIAESTQSAYALVLCQDVREVASALETLRGAGWHAGALTPSASLEEVWLQLDRSATFGLAP